MNSYRLASIFIILLIIYVIIDNHVPIPPWNQLGKAGSQLNSTLVGVIPLSLVLLAIAQQVRWGIIIGAIWAAIWFILQIRQWWIPYLFGPTRLHSDFTWYTANGYEETLRFLPVILGRPVPDAQHMVLQLLSLAVLMTLVMAARR